MCTYIFIFLFEPLALTLSSVLYSFCLGATVQHLSCWCLGLAPGLPLSKVQRQSVGQNLPQLARTPAWKRHVLKLGPTVLRNLGEV